MRLLAALAALAALWSAASGCNPGRGGIRRRGARKLTPLVYKQHVPNFSERSVAAAGGPEGAVARTSPGFERRLVPNYNPDIVFKDEEGTGADRLMTPRCKEKLNTLSISVLNQWPGVSLRVTEAWDEDGHHSDQSLHYEGRAVDVTTSDRDRKKYGMLARLAVEAGFDWVYYESRSHVHASCKSEATNLSKNGGCFPGSSTVLTSDGTRKPLSDLRVGDRVLAAAADGAFVFSPVLLFLDRKPQDRALFYTLHTDSGHSVTATPMHLVYAAAVANEVDVEEDEEVAFEATFARDVNEGDLVLVQDGAGPLRPARVVRVEAREGRGVYAPLTAEGNVVVDNVLASCYAVIDSQTVAHAAFAPIRALGAVRDWMGVSNVNKEETSSGVHWYADALYYVARRWIHDDA